MSFCRPCAPRRVYGGLQRCQDALVTEQINADYEDKKNATGVWHPDDAKENRDTDNPFHKGNETALSHNVRLKLRADFSVVARDPCHNQECSENDKRERHVTLSPLGGSLEKSRNSAPNSTRRYPVPTRGHCPLSDWLAWR